jgi:hypothetical protein
MAFLLLRRLIPAVLLAATATVSGSAIGQTPVACAVPGEWDVGAYDSCIAKVVDRNIRGVTTDAQMLEEAKFCCQMSGGEWSMSAGGPNGGCVAPAAGPPQNQSTRPGTLPGNATQTLEPAPGPVVRVPLGPIENIAPAG